MKISTEDLMGMGSTGKDFRVTEQPMTTITTYSETTTKEQPSHYTENGISPMECFRNGLISTEEYVGFCKGNVIKYLCRSGLKNGESALDDYMKAKDYVEELIKIEKLK